MVTADVWPLLVNCAASGLGIEVDTFAVGSPGQGEDFSFEVEIVDYALFFETPGNLLGRLFRFKRIDQAQPHQVLDPHLNRHSAAEGLTVPA